MGDIVRYVGDVVTAIRGRSRPSGGANAAKTADATNANGAASVAIASTAPAANAHPAPTKRPSRTAASRTAGLSRAAGEGAPATMTPAGARPAKSKAMAEASGPHAAAAPALVCPRCRQAALVTGKRGWGCGRWREGCSFVIWFETAGRRLTDAQLRELVAKGKTRKATWSPSGDPAERLAGRLVLDAAAGPPAGSARFEPA